MEDTHANPLFFSDNPLLLLLFEETSRAKKAGPSPLLATQIHFTPEMRMKKMAHT